MLEILLYENAYDSIKHGLEHLDYAKKKSSRTDYKHALICIFQGSELLLKQLLCLINPILIFDKNSLYDNCNDFAKPTLEELYKCKSLDVHKLCSEVKKQYPDTFTSLSIVEKVAKERNKIQHFGIAFNENDIENLITELFHQTILPAFKLIGEKKSVTNDFFKGELERIFNFYDIADQEEKILELSGQDFYRMNCHHCGNYSLFMFYDSDSYPVRYYCTSCKNTRAKIYYDEFYECPECGALSLIYDNIIEAGICVWYRCANNRDGGIPIEMEYCSNCDSYKIEGFCNCHIEQG